MKEKKRLYTSLFSNLSIVVYLFFTLFAALIVAIYLVFNLNDRIDEFNSASMDQTIWNIFQLETDFLKLLLSGEEFINTEEIDDKDLLILSKNFDLFYSRVNTYLLTVENRVLDSDYLLYASALRNLLSAWTAQFDSNLVNDQPAWKEFLDELKSSKDYIRSLTVDGLQILIKQEEQTRLLQLERWTYYRYQLLIIMAVIAISIVATLLLMMKLHSRTRNAEQNVIKLQRSTNALEVLAVTDPLTGLLTRRALENLEDSLEETDLLVVWIDIDDFKSVNDKFGHKVGDLLLKKIAKHLQNHSGHKAKVFRLGGEEFGIIKPWLSDEETVRWAERLCQKIERVEIDTGSSSVSRTASIGVVRSSLHSNLEQALEMADRAMFVAKENGKNQVIFRTHFAQSSA